MAVSKAIRTNPPAQPKPQQAKTGLAGDPGPKPQQAGPKAERPTSNRHQFKAEIFDVLRNLNRGYGVALAALDKLETKARRIFPTDFLHGYRSRAEALRAETNRDLLRILAGHEDQDATRFAVPLTAKAAKNAKS